MGRTTVTIGLLIALSLSVSGRAEDEGSHSGTESGSESGGSDSSATSGDRVGLGPGSEGKDGGGCENLKDRPQQGVGACWAVATATIRDFKRGAGRDQLTDEKSYVKGITNGEYKRAWSGSGFSDIKRLLRKDGMGFRFSSLSSIGSGKVAIVRILNSEGGGHFIAVCRRNDGKFQVADSEDPEHGKSSSKVLAENEIAGEKGKVTHVLQIRKKFLGIF